MRAGAAWRDASVFPFTAVNGQDEPKLALCLAVVCPELGGVLLSGEKGAAKSTLARGLASLLPGLGGSGAFLDLPLSVSEDRLLGCVDLETALREGRLACQPGLLTSADKGVLYVDEVNLLPDHIVDALLDAASAGAYVLEREGLSRRFPSRFLLVGSMNPEEGQLRPQLLDRFGLCVDVSALREPGQRVRLLREMESYDADPRAFCAAQAQARDALVGRLKRGRAVYPAVRLTERARERVVELAAEANAAGQRPEILLSRAARAFAAWNNRIDATPEDVQAVAELVLRHRRRMASPPQDKPQPQERPQDQPEKNQEEQPQEQDHKHEHSPPDEQPQQGREQEREETQPEESNPDEDSSDAPAPAPAQVKEQVFEIGEAYALKPIALRKDRIRRKTGAGRRAPTRTQQQVGRCVGARLSNPVRDLAFDATLRAAAPYQARRKLDAPQGLAVRLRPQDLREKVREKRVGALIVLVVDASSSMGAARRMREAKAAVLSWLLDAYQKRDRIAFVAFRGQGAQTLLPPTNSVERAFRLLEELPTGGRTPLAHGLAEAYGVIDAALRKAPATIPLLVILSDGRANVALGKGKPLAEALELGARIAGDSRVRSYVVDVEPNHVNALGLAGRLAESLRGRHVKMEDLCARELANLFQRIREER